MNGKIRAIWEILRGRAVAYKLDILFPEDIEKQGFFMAIDSRKQNHYWRDCQFSGTYKTVQELAEDGIEAFFVPKEKQELKTEDTTTPTP